MKRGDEETRHKISPSRRRSGHINLPIDLIVEILKKLPAKSLVKFQCVSKFWSSIINNSRNFIDSIVTRSLTQPRRDAHIIFDIASRKSHLALSSTRRPKNTYKDLLLVPQECHRYVRGLICCWSRGFPHGVAIYNPTTRQCFNLPNLPKFKHTLTWGNYGTFFFGYDPLKDQYKVLFLLEGAEDASFQVFTLGDSEKKHWRTIQGYVGPHYTLRKRGVVCINGVIYYLTNNYINDISKVMSFDVGTEKFCQVDAPNILTDYKYTYLINYQEKLGFVRGVKGLNLWDMEIWVMEKQGWSKIFCWEMKKNFQGLRVTGVTRDGKIVMVKKAYDFYDMLCVYYYDPKGNSIRYLNLGDYYTKGSRNKKYWFSILSVPDHVENTMLLK